MKRLTTEQAAATEPHHSIWVGASAGTGKTYVLTARVLRLLLTGTPAEHILCLTFTKAAAAEMSTRIYAQLGEWTGLADKPLAASIWARANERADEGMLAVARGLFAEVLDLPGGLKVQTIHSFCQSLLGRFPAEANLSPRFQVMDERTTRELLEDSLERVLAAAGDKGNEELSAALSRVAVQVSEQSFSDLMAAVAKERGHFRLLLKRLGGPEGVSSATLEGLGLPADSDRLIDHLTADQTLDRQGLLAVVEALADGSTAEQARAAAISEFLAAKEGAGRAACFTAYMAVFLTQKDAPRVSVVRKATLRQRPGLEPVIATETARLEAAARQLKLLEAARNSAAFTRLAAAVIETYERAKRRRGLMDYDDLILNADRLLQRRGIAPWILYKLDGGIDHILVDEAQDTNPEQWRLLEELSREFFVGEGAREVDRSLFAVGDAKQSIFGFQRADPAEFERAAGRVEERAKAADLTFRSLSLIQSFRSTAAVLETVDAVFARPEARCDLVIEDQEIVHVVRRLGHSGRVELWPSETAEAEDELEAWAAPLEQEPVRSSAARLALKTAKHIERLITGKDELKARGRPVQPGDIMVLVRRRTEFVDHLVRALKAIHIPVAGTDRMELTDQLAVMDLMAAAEFVLLPHDDLTLATVLKGPFIGLAEDDLFALAHGRAAPSLWQALVERRDELVPFGRAHAFLSELLAEADRDAPFDFFSHLLNSLGGRRALIARLGLEINDPVDEFLNLTLEFERSHLASLQAFLAWLRTGKAEIKRDMERGRNEVRVLTVHGAKGLQAPVVYLPDTCALPPDRESLLRLPVGGAQPAPPDLLIWPGRRVNEVGVLNEARLLLRRQTDAEYRRLLYVALTRAQDRLYLGGFETRRGPQEGSWYSLLAAAFKDLEGAQSITDPVVGDVARLENDQDTAPEDDGQSWEAVQTLPELPRWATRKPPAEAVSLAPITPSKFDTEVGGVIGRGDGALGMAARRGELVHKLLEQLPKLGLDEREQACRNYLSRPAFRLEKNQIDEIWVSLSKILSDPEFGPLFGPGSRAEVAIAATVGGRPLSGRIDRLIVAPDQVLIVDYKSNRLPPDRTEGVPPAYLAQLAAYTKVIDQIYPDRPVRAALLWTSVPCLMPVHLDLLEPHLAALEDKAATAS
jgi:ATP-dependent helicase/nuclease subunit A